MAERAREKQAVSRHSKAHLKSGRWAWTRREAVRAANWQCEKCGGRGPLEVHHPIPIAQGGAVHDPSNLQVLCRGCHIAHHHPGTGDSVTGREEWAAYLKASG